MSADEEPSRPDPDALLSSLQAEEQRRHRGRLRVFLGMAPGVGKTYSMLQAAQRAKAAGREVLVGLVETHQRPETEALLSSLPQIPRQRRSYRGTELFEFDLEAALARGPSLLLLDELAHTNAPGSRHAKRFQDVEELLAAGIDVFTTLNVQHLESRADVVHQITGAPVQETVPDSVLDGADEIQLVDLTPAQLRERLQKGQVYLAGRGVGAAENFFKESNLTALRELALRVTAERVDHQLRNIRATGSHNAIWRSGERLLVAVGPSPFSTRLIRWTRRMAYALDAPWLAVSVETGHRLQIEDQKRLDENLALARELGADVIVVPGTDIARTLASVAHQRNVSQIVVGKPRGHSWIRRLLGGSLVDHLLRHSGQIDVYVVPAEPRTPRSRWLEWAPLAASRPREYALGLLAVAVTTGLMMLAAPYLGYFAPSLVYMAVVMLLGLFLGPGPIFLAATISAVAWNFLFIPPVFTFRITRLEDGLMFAVFLITAVVTGRLTTRIRAQQAAERLGAQRSGALYLLSRAIATSQSADEIIRNASAQLQELFGTRMAVFTLVDDRLQLHPSATYEIDAKELAVAEWTQRHRKMAGKFTETLPTATSLYFPLIVAERSVGVVGLHPPPDLTLTTAQRDVFENFAGQLARALEREQLRTLSEAAHLATESEKLHRTLLDSISHELKTPLAVISGTAESLRFASSESVAPLAAEIHTASRRLQQLVNNLLDVTRLESGALRPRFDWCDLRDVVQAALDASAEVRQQHPTQVTLPEQLLLVRADFALLEQAIFNLLHNAATHTPAGTTIEVRAGADPIDREVWISVQDHGPGLPAERAARIFERFSRTSAGKPGGLGLGLSIVRGFVEAHQGRVEVGGVPGGGASFTVFIPALESGSVPVE
ncbi:MAG TPA: sensor histidine kinase KdpD [Opitutaceae bacterium]|nr:sensor histidine kinase KdpD [Opitutaceae bacterium]